ncbi:MAG: pilus assembly protein TadB [Alphaproteobacteria bacterium]|nr:MAG: pilus assembly protein TadB [Alphaproteobacteria bacterium]
MAGLQSFLADNPDIALAATISLPLGLLLIIVVLLTGDGGRKTLSRRIARIRLNHEKKAPTTAQISIARPQKRASDINVLDHIIRRLMPRQELLRLRIERAGLSISIGIYVLASLLIGTLGLVAANMLWNWPLIPAVLIGITAGLLLPHVFLGVRIKRRQAKFIDLFPDAIDLMVRGIKAGLPVTESIRTASEEIADPVGTEFKRITDGVRIGRPLDEVLWEASRRLDLQEFNFFTIALSIQSETGGNLAETLGNLSDVLRGRRQLKRKIRALSSEAKASAYIIGSLPFVMTLLIYLVNSEYILGLFRDPRGQALIGFGLFMVAAGSAVMYRMVKFEV